jgi:WD40 repeat protein
MENHTIQVTLSLPKKLVQAVDNSVKIWDFSTGDLINTFTHDKLIRCKVTGRDARSTRKLN